MDTLTKAMLVAFAFIGILLAFFGGRFIFNLVKGWSVTSLPGSPVEASNSQTVNGTTGSTTPLQSNSGPAAAKWDGNSRINILLLGLDYTDERAINGTRSALL